MRTQRFTLHVAGAKIQKRIHALTCNEHFDLHQTACVTATMNRTIQHWWHIHPACSSTLHAIAEWCHHHFKRAAWPNKTMYSLALGALNGKHLRSQCVYNGRLSGSCAHRRPCKQTNFRSHSNAPFSQLYSCIVHIISILQLIEIT